LGLPSFESNISSICGGGGGGPAAALVSNNKFPFEHSKVHQHEPCRVDSPAFHPPHTTTTTNEDRPLSCLELATAATCSTLQQPETLVQEPVQRGETNLKENGGDLPTVNVELEKQQGSGDDAMDCNQLTEDDASTGALALDGIQQDTWVPSEQQEGNIHDDSLAAGTALPSKSTNSEKSDICNPTCNTANATTANSETLTLFKECKDEGYDIYRAFVPVSRDILLGCNTFGMHTNTSDELPSGLAMLCPGYTDFVSVCFVRHQSVAKKVGFRRRDVLCLVDLDGSAAFAGSIRLFTEDEFES
jgi:hypothetical protein